MSNNISGSLDLLRRSIMSVILNNTDIKFTSIEKQLEDYVSNGDTLFKSFLGLMNFSSKTLCSSQASATYLLSYMDFFAIYALIHSNYIPVFQNLKNISENKYSHIYNLYKDLNALVKEKEAAQDYFYVLYTNFLFPKNIDVEKSGLVSRSTSSIPLNFKQVCTLPIKKVKEISPSSITYFSSDGTVSINDSYTGLDKFKFEILRKQNNKIGTVRSGGVTTANNTTVSTPDITGTIFGYFANSVYIEAKSVSKDENNNLASLMLSGSTNGFDWSSDFNVDLNTKTKILIEDDIELGLEVTFYEGMTIKAGDRWRVQVDSLNIAHPSLTASINFDILEPISYIKYLDTSSYKLSVEQSTIDRNRFSSEKVDAMVFDGRIGHIAVCEGSLNQYKTKLGQHDYSIQSKNGELYYKYDFKVSDIKAYSCEYERYGSIVFNPMEVENVNTITVDVQTHLPSIKPHSIAYDETELDQATKVSVPKSSLEFNIVAETDLSRAVIPILPADIISSRTMYAETDLATLTAAYPGATLGAMATTETEGKTYVYNGTEWVEHTEDNNTDVPLIFEHVVPDSIDHNESLGNIEYAPATYTPRFPVDEDYNIKNTDPLLTYNSEKMTEAASNYITASKRVTISEYFMKDTHSVFYGAKVNGITDIIDITLNSKWIQATNNIYYTYYVDESRRVHLAIRELDTNSGTLVPFTGTITGQIEMSSIDDLYKTPMVFEYTLGMI